MPVTQGKKKKPPTFHYLPKSRANRLKKSWIEDRKIRGKWKAQKKRDGLTNQTSPPLEDRPGHRDGETNADSEAATPLDCPEKLPTPPRDRQSLRDLGKIAYASEDPRTQKAGPLRPKKEPDRVGKATVRRETGQPNMKLRMNVLLEKIKRDVS